MSAEGSPATATRLGSYEVLHKFAKGGMAELFLARAVGPEGFQKLVVLKKILPSFAANQKFVRLFLDEAKLAASLDHPHIAHVYDLGMVDGNYFFTMEYVHGRDVRALLHRSLTTKIPLPIEHAVHVARSVATALHYAHERRGPNGKVLGIVHRDVSPSNIIVSYEGTVKLLDFGVAKAASSTVKTRTGALKGKVAYMSPEQAKGAAVDRRSDVFSTGIVLWEMITSRRLYKRDNDLATLQMIINEPPPRPSTVRADAPAELDRIVLRALAVDPDVRYQTAQELQADLDELAREHKLNQSTIALGRHMGTLFAAEVDLWRRAEEAGEQLSDHLIGLSEHRAERPAPASDAALDAFREHGGEDDEEDDGAIEPDDDDDDLDEPSSQAGVEADQERTERTDLPLAPSPLVTSEAAPSIAPKAPIRYSRPGLEPRNWASEPSIVLDDSVADADAAPVVAVPLAAAAEAAPLPIEAEVTEYVRSAPPRPVVAAVAVATTGAPPARRTGLWIGFVAASVVAVVVGVFVMKSSGSSSVEPAPGAAAERTSEPAPRGAEPAPTESPAAIVPSETVVEPAPPAPAHEIAVVPTPPVPAKVAPAVTTAAKPTPPAPAKVGPALPKPAKVAPVPAKVTPAKSTLASTPAAEATRPAAKTAAKPRNPPAAKPKPAPRKKPPQPAAKFDPDAALPPM